MALCSWGAPCILPGLLLLAKLLLLLPRRHPSLSPPFSPPLLPKALAVVSPCPGARDPPPSTSPALLRLQAQETRQQRGGAGCQAERSAAVAFVAPSLDLFLSRT